MADSQQDNASLRTWAKTILRIAGTINALAALAGMYFEFGSARFSLFRYIDPYAPPPFKTVVVVMMLINFAFDGLLLFTAIRFIQAKVSAVQLYSLTVLALVIYEILNFQMWRVGGDIGRCIAANTGVGNMGIAPFTFLFVVPDLYPIASALTVVFLKRSSRARVLATA